MKRFFGFLLMLGCGVALGRVFDGVSATAVASGGQGGGEEKCSGKNGDVNADGSLDLSDAVTILGNLFLGSPTELVGLCVSEDLTPRVQELEALLSAARAELATCQGDLEASAQAAAALTAQVNELQALLADCRTGNCPPSGAPLPGTGQATCYDVAGGVIACTSSACPEQDGFYRTGCPGEGRFVDNGNGTVTDNCTGLMWQKGTAPGTYTWCNALSYCKNLKLAGLDDWRLPNVRELQSIVDYERSDPSIDPVFSALLVSYWSSTTVSIIPDNAWGIRFRDGFVAHGVKALVNSVRAVRGGQ